MSAENRRRMLQEMLAETPDDAELGYALAMEDVSAGDHASAVKRFRELGALPKPHVPAFLMGAQSLVKMGKTSEAIALLRQGVAAAHAQGNMHAEGEMQGMIDSLE
jgi:predicted Zn-dependent protease